MTRTKDSWGACTIGDIAKVISGYAFKSSEFEEEGIPVIKIKNIRVGYTDLTDAQAVPESRMSLDSKYHVQSGNVLISLTGSHLTQPNSVVGRVAIHRGRPALLNQRAGKFIIDDTKCVPNFLFYTLSSSEYVTRIATMASGAASQANVSPSQVESISIPLPNISTQRKIASILSAYDDLIENNSRRIAILEEIAQAIYREWFVNFRFPGHENVKLVESTLGMIPEGWKTDKLSAIADVNARSIKNDLVPDCINYIDIASVSTGRINEIRPMTFAEAPGRARRIVRHGDVIWSTVRPNRRSYCIVIDPSPDTIASTGFAVLSPLSVPFSYLYYAVTTDDFASYLVNHATGSAYPAVSSKDFSDAELILPSTRLLQSFHGVVEETLLLSHRLQKKNRILGATRDLLLPKLISGLLDVEDLDIDTGLTAEELEEATA